MLVQLEGGETGVEVVDPLLHLVIQPLIQTLSLQKIAPYDMKRYVPKV